MLENCSMDEAYKRSCPRLVQGLIRQVHAGLSCLSDELCKSFVVLEILGNLPVGFPCGIARGLVTNNKGACLEMLKSLRCSIEFSRVALKSPRQKAWTSPKYTEHILDTANRLWNSVQHVESLASYVQDVNNGWHILSTQSKVRTSWCYMSVMPSTW